MLIANHTNILFQSEHCHNSNDLLRIRIQNDSVYDMKTVPSRKLRKESACIRQWLVAAGQFGEAFFKHRTIFFETVASILSRASLVNAKCKRDEGFEAV